MSWNVRYLSHGTGGAFATERQFVRVAEAIGALQPMPDVLALQEIENGSLRGGARPQLERLVGALHRVSARVYQPLYLPAHRYVFAGASVYTTGLGWLVAPSLPIGPVTRDDITHVRLPAFARLKQRRIATGVRVWLDGQPLDLFNTHLSLPAFLEAGLHQVPSRMGWGTNQLAEVDALLRVVGAPDRPVVVVGDFNAEPNSPVLARVRGAGWSVCAPAGPSAAFLGWRFFIDHVLHAPSVNVLPVDTGTVDEGPFAGLSDHAPRVVDLTIGADGPDSPGDPALS